MKIITLIFCAITLQSCIMMTAAGYTLPGVAYILYDKSLKPAVDYVLPSSESNSEKDDDIEVPTYKREEIYVEEISTKNSSVP